MTAQAATNQIFTNNEPHSEQDSLLDQSIKANENSGRSPLTNLDAHFRPYIDRFCQQTVPNRRSAGKTMGFIQPSEETFTAGL